MKIAIVFLFFITLSSICMSDELDWIPVNIPELEFMESGVQNFGVWFHRDFGWLNSGKQIWITNNAGRNWKLSLKPPENRSFYDSYFINSSEGWAIAGIFPSFLFHTKDGGVLWEPVEFQNLGNNSSLVHIYFKDSLNGMAVFTVDKDGVHWDSDIVAFTDDGGKRWNVAQRPPGAFGRITGSGNNAWIDYSDSRNTLFTPNLGKDIFELSRYLFYPSFVPSLYGWTLNYTLFMDGAIHWDVIVTHDGGFTWSQPILSLQGSSSNSYISICLLKEGEGAVLWISENSALLFYTADNGCTWLQYNIPVTSGYRLLCNQDRREIWLIPDFSSGNTTTLFYATIPSLTAVHTYVKFSTLWGMIKQERKGLYHTGSFLFIH